MTKFPPVPRRCARAMSCLFLLAATPGRGDGEAVGTKKLIAWGGIDWYSPETVQMHIREIEELPFDGTVLQGFKASKNGRQTSFDSECFGQVRFEREELADTIATLKNIDFRKFTDNFLRYNVTPGDVDWFDDFSSILDNARMWAGVTQEAGFTGWMFDTEDYKGTVFNYKKMKYAGEKTFTEYAEQARRRGRELIAAIQEECPEIVIMFSLAHGYVYTTTPQASRYLPENHNALLPPFVNGMIEGAGPGVRIIDGNENGYGHMWPEDHARARQATREHALALVPPELHEKYRAKMEAGIALFVNYVFAIGHSEYSSPMYHLMPEERLRLFEQNVYYALKEADEYAWCYSEHMGWWEEGWKNPTPDGALDAIRSGRDKLRKGEPLGFDMRERVTAARLKNGVALSSPACHFKWHGLRANLTRIRAGGTSPRIDGVLNDPLWEKVPRLDPFVPLRASAAKQVEAATTAQAVYDDDNLYIAFRCAEPETDGLRAVGVQDAGDVWRGDDVVGVLLSDAEADEPFWRQFVVNPQNARWSGNAGDGEQVNWRSGTRVGRDEWTVEMSIPWKAVGGRPAGGSSIRANLCRRRAATDELTNWSPMYRGFREPEYLAEWRLEK